MTPQAQRIAIAGACGWVSKPDQFYFDRIAWFHPDHKRAFATQDLPEYVSDLNAIHDAEKHLLKVHAEKYIRQLSALVEPEPYEDIHAFRYVTATAAQRAEAFLRTLNKWDDTK